MVAVTGGLVDHADLDLVPLAMPGTCRTVGLAFRKTSPRVDEFNLPAELLMELAPEGVEKIRNTD